MMTKKCVNNNNVFSRNRLYLFFILEFYQDSEYIVVEVFKTAGN